MKYARTPSGDLLDASLFPRITSELFCPNCGEPVHFRGSESGERQPHFAHNKYAAKDDCEDYHPSNSSISAQNHTAAFRSSVRLYLRYKAGRGETSDWELSLRIPRSIGSEGEVRIPDGKNGLITILSSELRERAKIVPVKLGVSQYRVLARGMTDRTASLFAKECSGLNLSAYNVFRYSASLCRMLDQAEPLFWGRRYFLMTGLDLEKLIPSFVRRLNLGKQQGVHCFLVVFPNSLDLTDDQQVAFRMWVREGMQRDLNTPPPDLCLVTPHIGYDEIEEFYEIDENAPVIVGISGELGTVLVRELSLHDRTGKRIYTSAVNIRPPICFAESENLQFYEYSIPENKFETLTVVRRSFAPKPIASPATFIFAKGDSPFPERISCFSPLLESKLKSALTGELTLTGLEAAQRLPLVLSEGEGTRGQRFTIQDNESFNPSATTASDFARRIQLGLKSMARFSLRIGNFVTVKVGDVSSEVPGVTEQIQGESYFQSRRMNQRARWLLTFSHLLNRTSETVPQDAIETSNQKATWPRELIAHARLFKKATKILRLKARSEEREPS